MARILTSPPKFSGRIYFNVTIQNYPTSRDKWLAMIEMRQIQFSLSLRVKQSRLHYGEFNVIIKTWTHNAFKRYKQWNNTTTTLKATLHCYSLLMSVCSVDSSAKCWVESIKQRISVGTRQFQHHSESADYQRVAAGGHGTHHRSVNFYRRIAS